MMDINLQNLLVLLGLNDHDFSGDVQFTGTDPIIYSPHRLGLAVSIVLAAKAVSTAAIWKMRTGKDQDIKINLNAALHHLHSIDYMWLYDHQIELHVIKEAITDFYQCADHR